MNESLISKIKDETARKVIYHQHLQIEGLKRQIERLEQKQTVQAIGFNVNAGETQIETAFTKKLKYTGTHD